MILIGLVLLLVAVVIGAVGVATNSGSADTLTNGFMIFGYEVTGSTGWLFLCGIIVGAVAMLGLALILRGMLRHGKSRRELRHTRREADDLRKRHEQTAGQTTGQTTGQATGHTTDQTTDQTTGQRDTTQAAAADDSTHAGAAEGTSTRGTGSGEQVPEQKSHPDEPSGLREKLGFKHRAQ